MEKNLEPNNEISDNNNNSNSEVIKDSTSEKVINVSENNVNSQNNISSKVEKNIENDIPAKTNNKSAA